MDSLAEKKSLLSLERFSRFYPNKKMIDVLRRSGVSSVEEILEFSL